MATSPSQKPDLGRPEPPESTGGLDAAGAAELADTEAEQPAEPTVDQRAATRRLVAFAVAAVLSVAVAVLVGVGAWTTMHSGARSNEAFTDTGETAAVVGQVANAITTVYSYDYRDLGATDNAARSVVTGRFVDEFERVFGPVKQLAPQQQAVLHTTVPAAGVTLMQGNRATLLMMVNQTGTRGPGQQPTGAAARLVVDAQKVDGRWKIAWVSPE
jgi:Mce-associated membrane protein